MLDIKFVRDNMELVQQGLINRGNKISLDEFLALEKERRVLLSQVEALKNTRNNVSQDISRLKKAKENADDLVAEMRLVGDQIGEIDAKVKEVELALQNIIINVPNLLHESVPVGQDEQSNVEVRVRGEQYLLLNMPPLPTGKLVRN